jgi:hypothetical protein
MAMPLKSLVRLLTMRFVCFTCISFMLWSMQIIWLRPHCSLTSAGSLRLVCMSGFSTERAITTLSFTKKYYSHGFYDYLYSKHSCGGSIRWCHWFGA